jgi:hypothetical protein
LNAVVERIAQTPPSKSPSDASGASKKSSESSYASAPESTHARRKLKVDSSDKKSSPAASLHPSPMTPTKGPTIGGKEIGRPVLNMGAYCRLATNGHAEQTGRISPVDLTLKLSTVKRVRRVRLFSWILLPCQEPRIRSRRSALGTSLRNYTLSFLSLVLQCTSKTSPLTSNNLSSPSSRNSTSQPTVPASSSNARCPLGK